MRKLIALILIFSILLCGCTTGHTDSVPQSSSVVENSSSVPQSSSVVESSSMPQSSSKLDMNPPTNKYSSDTEFRRYVKDAIIPFDNDKSDEYNNAMRIYKTYLGAAYTAEHTEFIDSFCFYDMNGDDIPELIISRFYHIYVGSVNEDEGKIEWWEDTGHSATNGPTKILANGMLASRSSSTGSTFTFLQYDKTGTATRTGFFVDPPQKYMFMGQDVSEEDFNRLAGPYLSAWENEAEVEWISYLGAVVGIPNNQPFIRPDEIDNRSAVDEYNKLLSEKFYKFNYDLYRMYYVDNYALFDMNGDNMPELILDISTGYYGDKEIWSYIDGQLIQFDTPQMWTTNGRIEILSNGMIGYNRSDLIHSFYIYGKDGSCTEKSFNKWNGDFDIDGKPVTEKEYNAQIAPYLKEIGKKAEIDWRPYFEKQ